MLIKTSDNPRTPSLAESLAEKKQLTQKALKQFKLADHDELKNAEVRFAHGMYHTEFIRRVEKATGRKIWAEDSYRDKNVIGFYTTKKGEKSYICSFNKGYMPEFSIIETDERDMPVREHRGWRTVLTRLLQTDSIRMFQIRNAFEIKDHIADDRWRANTQNFKG